MRSPKWIIVSAIVLFAFSVWMQSRLTDSTGEAIFWAAVVGVILAFGAWVNIRRLHKTDASGSASQFR